jgi:hypothetical protein
MIPVTQQMDNCAYGCTYSHNNYGQVCYTIEETTTYPDGTILVDTEPMCAQYANPNCMQGCMYNYDYGMNSCIATDCNF